MDAGIDPASLGAGKTLLYGEGKVVSLETSLTVEVRRGGGLERVTEERPRGRVIILSSPTASASSVGQTVGYSIGRYRLTVVRPVKIEEDRWNALLFLTTASVRRVGQTGTTPCPLRGDYFDCGGEGWMNVQATGIPFGGVWQNCIFAHPLNGSTLVLDFTVPLETASLSLAGGIDDAGVGYPLGTPVTLAVRAGKELLAQTEFANTPGFFTKNLPLLRTVHGNETLSFEISTKNQDTRHFCFTAEGLSPGDAAAPQVPQPTQVATP
jgi:hypothetical protein